MHPSMFQASSRNFTPTFRVLPPKFQPLGSDCFPFYYMDFLETLELHRPTFSAPVRGCFLSHACQASITNDTSRTSSEEIFRCDLELYITILYTVCITPSRSPKQILRRRTPSQRALAQGQSKFFCPYDALRSLIVLIVLELQIQIPQGAIAWHI
jgi:hypothetical protein